MSIYEQKSEPYHHGDLRNTLITAAVKMLKEEGMESLSLRKLARKIGVSHNAPYMHFADKEALLAGITTEGFKLLKAQITAASAAAGDDWLARFHDGCLAYVQFVLASTGHTQVMFRYYDPEKYPDTMQAATETLDLLNELIREGQQLGYVTAGDYRELATLTWSFMHGLAIIQASQKMPPGVPGGRTPEELTRHFLDLHYAGLQPRR